MVDSQVDNSVITIGNPKVRLKSLNGIQGQGTPYTHVSLNYLRDGQIVNLWRGDHPILNLQKSGISFTLFYGAQKSVADIAELIERDILREVDRILKATKITIARGEQCGKLGHFSITVLQDPLFKGLQIDPEAVAHDDWFRPRKSR